MNYAISGPSQFVDSVFILSTVSFWYPIIRLPFYLSHWIIERKREKLKGLPQELLYDELTTLTLMNPGSLVVSDVKYYSDSMKKLIREDSMGLVDEPKSVLGGFAGYFAAGISTLSFFMDLSRAIWWGVNELIEEIKYKAKILFSREEEMLNAVAVKQIKDEFNVGELKKVNSLFQVFLNKFSLNSL